MIMLSYRLGCYKDDYCRKHLQTIRYLLDQGKVAAGVFLIVNASNPRNLLEIIPANQFVFPYYRSHDFIVFGMARGRDSAIEMTGRILLDVCTPEGVFRLDEVR